MVGGHPFWRGPKVGGDILYIESITHTPGKETAQPYGQSQRAT